MAGEPLLIMLKNMIEDGCWHKDGEIITEDCATLDCHECFVAKAKSVIKKQERERIVALLKKYERVGLEFSFLPDHITFSMPCEILRALEEGK